MTVGGFAENVSVDVEGFSGAFGERWIRIVKLDHFVSMASNIDAVVCCAGCNKIGKWFSGLDDTES